MMGRILFSLMILAVLFQAESSFAAKVCLQDSFGATWELKGGKIDKKTYTLKRIPASQVCVSPGYADATQTISGAIIVGSMSSHDNTGSCIPVLWYISSTSFFTGTGSYDQLGDGSIEGTFTIAPISCTAVPALTKPNKGVKSFDPAVKQ